MRARSAKWMLVGMLGIAPASLLVDVGIGSQKTEDRSRGVLRDRADRIVLDNAAQRINYTVEGRLQGAAVAEVSSTPAASQESVRTALGGDLSVDQEWYRVIFGTGIGATGMHVVDLAGDGVPKVLAGASPGGFGAQRYWYVLRYDGTNYQQEWASRLYDTAITALRVVQIDEDAALEVVVAIAGDILIYDGSMLIEQHAVHTTANTIRGLRTVDVDGDDDLEFVFCNDNGLYIYDVDTGTQEYTNAAYAGVDLDVGNVDADDDLEIVISSGKIVNGVTYVEEWNYPSGFGSFIRLGDLNGDEIAEIVGGAAWYRITIFDGALHSPLTELPIDLDLDALQVVDVEGDGPMEIVYGDGQWGEVYVHDGATLELKWSVDNPEHGVTDVAIGDSDGDGIAELLWGAGYSSTGPDYLFVADTTTHMQEWQSLDVRGPFYALDYGDVDNDGQPELLYGCFDSDSGYSDGLYFVLDAVTKELEYQSDEPTGLNWTGLWRICHANVDDDPQAEIFITTSVTYTAMIIAYDGITHQKEWELETPSGLVFRSMSVADVDLDGVSEIVASVYREHTGAPGTYLYVFDARTGDEEWHSVDLGSYWASLSLLRIANIDDDPQPEMLVAEHGGSLFAHDGINHLQQIHSPDLGITALGTADLDGDGRHEIYVGTTNGDIALLDPESGAVVETISNQGAQIDGLQIVDVTGDCLKEFVFAADDEIRILDSAGAGLLWNSANLGSSVGAQDSLMVADIDRDHHAEIVVNLGAFGIQILEVDRELLHVETSTPSSGAIDARRPFAKEGSGAPSGWESVEVRFNQPLDDLDPRDITLAQIGGEGKPPEIADVLPTADPHVWIVLFSEPIRFGAWTEVAHSCLAQPVRLGFLPGDVDGDRLSSVLDIVTLVDHLNGIVTLEDYQTDMDRDGTVSPVDVLELINLLNGAGAYPQFNGVGLP